MSEDSEDEGRYNSDLEDEEVDCDDSSDEDYVTSTRVSRSKTNTRRSGRQATKEVSNNNNQLKQADKRQIAAHRSQSKPKDSGTTSGKRSLRPRHIPIQPKSSQANIQMNSHNQMSRNQNSSAQSQLNSQMRNVLNQTQLHHQLSQQQMRAQLPSNYAAQFQLQNQSRHGSVGGHQVVSHQSTLQQIQQQQMSSLRSQQQQQQMYSSTRLRSSNRSQAASSGPAGIHPSQKVPMGLSSIAGYANTGNLSGVSHGASRYSSSAQVAQAAQAVASALTAGYAANLAAPATFPISPDVKLKNLPFYDTLGELLKPSTLAPHGTGRYQETVFTFSLTPQQANKVALSRDTRNGKQDYHIQVQMRFCLLETTCEQEDNFPPNIAVKINDKMCPLPSPIPANKAGVEPKRPSKPVNITALCRISPTVSNRIHVSWSSEYSRCYVISVYLVQKLTSEDLLLRLKNKGSRIADYTRTLIKQKLMEDADCEIATTSLKCSLLCPLGKMKMMLPCRASTCDHLQCFDASLFLQMNERKPTWTCPVCDKTAMYSNLHIDGYFQDVLQSSNCTEVTLQKDGSWTPLIQKKEPPKQEIAEKKKAEVSIETLSDDSSDDDAPKQEAQSSQEEVKKRKTSDIEMITLSDSDDDSAPPPAKKQNTAPAPAAPLPKLEMPVVNSGTASSSGGGSASPQIICLDSPASSPSPPNRREATRAPSPPNVTVTPTTIPFEQSMTLGDGDNAAAAPAEASSEN